MTDTEAVTARWHPILPQATAGAAQEAFVALVRSVAGIGPQTHGRTGARLVRGERTLSQGTAGLAVLERAIRVDPLGADLPAIDRQVVDAAWREIETCARFEMALFTGHTGLLWTMAYLDDSACGAVAAATARLAEGLRTTGASTPMHFDLVLGAAGLLVLGRLVVRRTGDVRLLRAVHDWLAHTEHRPSVWRTPTGRYREVPPDVAGEFYVDWGVAHGVPGVVGTLVHSRLDLGEVDRAGEHLDRFASACAALDVDVDAAARPRRPLLPIFSGPGGLQFGDADSWCYGDAGAGAVLASASLATGDPRQRGRAELYLDAAAHSLGRALGRVDRMEPGLCHGVAGIALVAARLHHLSGDSRFAELATAVVDRALDTGRFAPDRIIGAYGHGLLRGVSGVALALHALLSWSAPEWDMILALS